MPVLELLFAFHEMRNVPIKNLYLNNEKDYINNFTGLKKIPYQHSVFNLTIDEIYSQG